MSWQASAPSNIALIKYMGKTDHGQNLPTNVSFSYTTDHLRTFVELEKSDSDTDSWEPLTSTSEARDLHPISLSEKGQKRYLDHLLFLKKEFSFNGFFKVRSANNFPAACGIASSASSFAALTLCAAKAIKDLKNGDLDDSAETLSQLSRQGSGSSCRSFYPGWVKWEKNEITQLDLPNNKLYHQVFVAEAEEKEVATSLAHKIVPSSLLFDGRSQRAEMRFESLINELKDQDWKASFETSWSEFWDMHSLFETSRPSFGYMNDGSLKILNTLRALWNDHGDGPIVTMDAGPNVHAFYRADQKAIAEQASDQLSQFTIYDNLDCNLTGNRSLNQG